MTTHEAPATPPGRDQVIEVLKTIEDPEIFLDIWFLGLIYSIEIEERRIGIQMTFTSPMCPAGPWLVEEVRRKVKALPTIEEVDVRVTFEPPWQPSEEVKAMLGMI